MIQYYSSEKITITLYNIVIIANLCARYVSSRGIAINSGVDPHAGDRESGIIVRHDPREYLTRELHASLG